MQYLDSFDDKLNFISESDYTFFDLYNLQEHIFGAPFIEEHTLQKVLDIKSILSENDNSTAKALEDSNFQPSGVRLRLATDSSALVIKAELKRKYAHQKMTLFCSSGFDIYEEKKDGFFEHKTVVAPQEPYSASAHLIEVTPNKAIEIYFPLYNKVERFALGIKKGSKIIKAKPYKVKRPVVFYGNSCTQGASASRSGNAFPNIVSRNLSCDIINFSFSAACKAEKSMAKQIAYHDMSAFVMDYTRNAASPTEFRERYEPFYNIIRKSNPDIPVIFIGAFKQPIYDKILIEIYERLKRKGHEVFFIRLEELFKDIDQVALSVDNLHYTDIGMFRVANKISEYLQKSSSIFFLESR